MKFYCRHTHAFRSAVIAFFLLLSACSQQPTNRDLQIPGLNPERKESFAQQKQKLLARDPDVDFTELRMSYTTLPGYAPWDTLEHEASLAMLNAMQDSQYELCLQFAKAILDENYTSLGGHFGMYSCLSALDRQVEAAFHRYVITGLMHSIESSGDGITAETAFVTISASEMRAFLQLKGLLSYRQEYVGSGAKHIEKLYVLDSKTEEHLELYFDNSVALMRGLSLPEPKAPAIQAPQIFEPQK